MEKLITFAVPSYNSQDYLHICLESLLVGGEDVEIIIVNDGSKDNTAKIADEYQAKYPTIVRAVHKENGGHGSGVNKGLELAQGLYYKVVDSDDWVGKDAVLQLIKTIKEHREKGEIVDMYISNFVYEHVLDKTSRLSDYKKFIPSGKIIGWKDTKPLKSWRMFLMHTLVIRTELLRDAGVVLPEHTFYVDNVFAYSALPHAKTLYYLDVDLYHYLIGRADQSITIENIVKRYDQQVRCMGLMLAAHKYEFIKKQCKQLQKQLYHFLDATLMNTYFFTTAKDTPERRAALKNMWAEFKQKDKKLYKKARKFSKVRILNGLTWKLRGKLTTSVYLYLCKHVKLGF